MAPEKASEMLRKIAEYYGITKNVDLAEFFGVTPQTSFQRVKKGIIDFEDIYNRCPDISPDWLLSGGQGPMLRSERNEVIASQNTNIGDGASQNVSVNVERNVEKLLDALHESQAALSRSQEQVTELISIVKAVRN